MQTGGARQAGPSSSLQTPADVELQAHDDAPVVAASVIERVGLAMTSGTAIPALFVDGSLTIQWASESIYDLTGHRAADLVGRPALESVHPSDLPALVDVLAAELVSPTAYESNPDPARRALRRLRVADALGDWVPCDMAATNLIDDPDVRGFLILLVRATDQWHRDEAHRALVRGRPVAEIVGHAIGMLMALIPGVTVEYVEHATPATPFPVDPHRPASGGFTVGGLTPEITRWAAQVIDDALGLVRMAIQRDAAAAVLREAAATDMLTGLANRRALTHRLDEIAHRRSFTPVGFIFIDLDHFKAINDTQGHEAGDDVLQRVGAALGQLSPLGTMTVRLGGDEFGVLVEDLQSPAELQALAERMRACAANEAIFPSTGLSTGASAGYAIAFERDDLASLIRRADEALLRAKRGGRQRTETGTDQRVETCS